MKLLDPPAQTQGGGGNGEPAPEFLALDAVVNVFSDNRLLLSFSAGGEPVKVLLPLDYADVTDRHFYAKTFDRPDPETDVQMVLFFQERAWLPRYDDYDLDGRTLSPEAQEKVDTFLAFAPSIHAELLLPPGGNAAAEGQLSSPPGARGFVRVTRRHTDADRDGIADALEFAGLAGFPDLLLDPFAQDADGDGVPDFVQAVAAIGERTRPGGGEIDPTAPPLPAYTPPRFAVMPLGGEFILESASEAITDAWITDTVTIAAVKQRSNGKHHYLWRDGETTEVWPRDEEQYSIKATWPATAVSGEPLSPPPPPSRPEPSTTSTTIPPGRPPRAPSSPH